MNALRFEDFCGRDGVEQAERLVVSPPSVDKLKACLAHARETGLRVRPCGFGTKAAASEGVDVWLSTKRLPHAIEYEPGDGTVTAGAGTPLAELARVTSAGGHHLTPEVPRPEETSLGGAIAAGRSGFDRLRHGPLRHHVLGLEFVTSAGESARCGGRLVKNVTGFELGRLLTGSEGSLAVIVAASLRLFPLPDREAVVTAGPLTLAEAATCTDELLAVLWRPLGLVWRRSSPGHCTLDLVLDGRAEPVAAELARATGILAEYGADVTVVEGEEARRRRRELSARELPDGVQPDLRLACRRSRAAWLVSDLDGALPEDASWIAHPGVATVDCWSGDGALSLEACARWRSSGVQLLPRRLHLPPGPPPRGHALMQRLRATLDADGVLDGSGLGEAAWTADA